MPINEGVSPENDDDRFYTFVAVTQAQGNSKARYNDCFHWAVEKKNIFSGNTELIIQGMAVFEFKVK